MIIIKNNISNLSEFGLIQIQTKQTFKSKTFSEIQAENNLPENSIVLFGRILY